MMERYQQQMADIINSSTTKTTITLARQSGKQTYSWYDESANTEFDKRYNWCLENLGPATDYPPRWWPVDLGRGSFRFRNTAANDWALTFLPDFDIMCESKGKNLASRALYEQWIN